MYWRYWKDLSFRQWLLFPQWSLKLSAKEASTFVYQGKGLSRKYILLIKLLISEKKRGMKNGLNFINLDKCLTCVRSLCTNLNTNIAFKFILLSSEMVINIFLLVCTCTILISLTRDVDKRDKQLHLYTCYLVKISHGIIKLSKCSHFVANKTLKSHLAHKQNIHILKA